LEPQKRAHFITFALDELSRIDERQERSWK
jgi:hypothetical protein